MMREITYADKKVHMLSPTITVVAGIVSLVIITTLMIIFWWSL